MISDGKITLLATLSCLLTSLTSIIHQMSKMPDAISILLSDRLCNYI